MGLYIFVQMKTKEIFRYTRLHIMCHIPCIFAQSDQQLFDQFSELKINLKSLISGIKFPDDVIVEAR